VIWQTDLRVIRDHPWFGVGLGVFPFIVHRWAVEDPRAAWIPQGTPPHSLFLDMGAEVGILGAVAFLYIPITGIFWALRRQDLWRNGAIAAMVGMMVAEVRDNILIGFHMALGFILILAMLVAPPKNGES
jgi:O-antigen ligase